VKLIPKAGAKTDSTSQALDLQEFFPYLVRVFYTEVTSAVSAVYQSDHELSPAEWRSMAILGTDQSLTANEIVERSSMDKVTVSRAIKRLNDQGLVKARENKVDARSKLLKLTKKGARLYQHLVPQVLEVERQLLCGISDAELKQFIGIMDKIKSNKERYSL